MTQATGRVPFIADEDHPLPMNITRPLGANVAPFRGWHMGADSNGRAVAQAAGVLGLVSLGVADRDQAGDATAGNAWTLQRSQWLNGLQVSSASGDPFTDADLCVPAWSVDNQTIGKLSNSGGVNRSLFGLVFGLCKDNGTPWVWTGPIAWTVARSSHCADNESAGSYQYPADAGATTDYAAAIPMARRKTHGVITSVEIIPSAGLAATSGNDRTITIKKRDSLGVAAAVTVATFTTTTALTAFKATAFTLTATAADLQMLETDYLSIENSHAGSGAVVPASAIRCNMKVQ